MFLKVIIIFISIFSLIALHACYNRRCIVSQIKSVQDQKKFFIYNKESVILWDLHQVIFERSIVHWAYLFMTHIRPISIISRLDMPTLRILGTFILKKMNLATQEITSEELIAAARNAGNNAFIDLIVLISCDYTPNPVIVSLVQKLHTKGYTLHVGSNIGQTVFETFYKKYSALFALFTHYEIVHVDAKKPVVKKPNPLFFLNYLKEKKSIPAQVIFIDDRPANVLAAQKVGIIGILYKNPDQLKQDLSTLAII